MADIREQILVRLLAILTAGVDRVRRNSDDLSSKTGSAAVLFDGDETSTDLPIQRNSRGDPRVLKDFMHMTPTIAIVVAASTPEVGTALNGFRSTFLPAIINDATLISLVGPNGEIRYTGLTMETQAGENREGRLTLDFRFQYVLNINQLGS